MTPILTPARRSQIPAPVGLLIVILLGLFFGLIELIEGLGYAWRHRREHGGFRKAWALAPDPFSD